MPRSSFGLASLWGGLTVLSLCGSASAQWFSGGSGCGCNAPTLSSAPIFRQTAAAFGAAPTMPASYAYNDVQCGAPIACHIEQPVQVVHVQAVAPVVHQQVVAVQPMQAVAHPVMQDVKVTEYQPVKRTISKPVMTTEWVDQPVTVMRPVTEQRTVNVASVDYQTVTEYKTVKKDVGYWVTKNVPTGKVNAWQYDNRPNAAGYMNRASYNMRTAFQPQYVAQRSYQPQTMTCTIPCQRRVAVPGMKQITYNTTRMVPQTTTQKVAVNRMSYQQAEVTVMQPVQVVRTMQVGTHLAYHPMGSTAATAARPATGGTAGLTPVADPNSSAAQPKPTRTTNADNNDGMNPNEINNGTRGAIDNNDPNSPRVSERSVPVNKISSPSVVRVSQWVARTPSSTSPQPGGKSAAIAIADSTR